MSILATRIEDLKKYASGDEITTRQIIAFEEDYPEAAGILNEIRSGALPRLKKGRYSFNPNAVGQVAPIKAKPMQEPKVHNPHPVVEENLPTVMTAAVPAKNPTFVAFGIHADLRKVIQSGVFAPVYIVGDSGNGKTFITEQICANLGRPFDLISIDSETNYDHLVARVGLKDGSTIVEYGVVARAMKSGAILLLDEIDRGLAKNLMCIQAVMNGDPLTIKETGEVIHPAPGFNIIATGNTKGMGDDTDRFISADCLDEAFLERFPITLEQSYPSKKIEMRILQANGMQESDADLLTEWANKTRESYTNDTVDNFITTRRLCHIVKNYKIYGQLTKAVKVGCARFSDDIRDTFVELFKSMSPHFEEDNNSGEDNES